ncbi:MAG: sensor domain-containing diguanylate cyclase [Syntrophobacteraceae bacterium]|jgi:diguanylate cyclase (GGDEF)-like protein
MLKRGRKKSPKAPAPPSPAPCENTADEGSDLQRLRLENEALRKELAGVLANASENEKIWRHFAAVERLLFRTRELDRLVEELLREIKDRFLTGLLVLYLSHPEALERFFQGDHGSSLEIGANTWISPLDGEEARSLFGPALKPVLFSAGGAGYLEMLSASRQTVRSGALIPLKIGEALFGALLLGSPDPERYRPEDGTDLLEQLGVNIALSMDNCLTYEKVRDFSVKDQLTGLYNFFQIHTILEKEFRKARRSGSALSVLLIDLNFLQDWEEFENGMEVLRHAARVLGGILPVDDCFTGRYGGDEFLIVLPGVLEEEAREVVPYISSTMRKSPYLDGNTAILITTAIGVGSLNEGTAGAQDLVDAAYGELCAVKLRHVDYRSTGQ